MSEKVTKKTIRDSVQLIERRYKGGLVEIAFYVKAIWAGGAPILTGVISSQKVEGQARKWHLYDTSTQPRTSHRLKSRVVDNAINLAQAKADELRQKHGDPKGSWNG